jgi:lipopolysaccharide export LptBFGC system permease protein LptF
MMPKLKMIKAIFAVMFAVGLALFYFNPTPKIIKHYRTRNMIEAKINDDNTGVVYLKQYDKWMAYKIEDGNKLRILGIYCDRSYAEVKVRNAGH